MSQVGQARATVDDLYRTPGKAELIGGRIVEYMATGRKPGLVGGNIFASLRDFTKKTGRGAAYPDNVGFTVSELVSGRESFAPDASYDEGPGPANPMRFVEHAPKFAAEVRSENDYGDTAEAEIAAKRADYFEAGTSVVWDVDTQAECIHVYRHTDPTRPTTYKRGDIADAEPAVPGWRIPVDEVFWMPA